MPAIKFCNERPSRDKAVGPTETRSLAMTRRAVALKGQPRRPTLDDARDVVGILAFGSSVLFILALLLQ